MSLHKAAEHNPELFKSYCIDTGLKNFLVSDVNKVIPNPLLAQLPINKKWASPPEIDLLHSELSKKLGIPDVYLEMTWKFNRRFTTTYGQAEYDIIGGIQTWAIQYASRYWLKLSEADRKNLITHEMCHLAVERLCGHGKKVNKKLVTGHGYHWKTFMERCGEDPNMIYSVELGDIGPQTKEPNNFDALIGLLKSIHETRTA